MSPVGQVSLATGGAAGGAEPRNTTCVPLAAAGAAALMVAPRIVTGAGTASPTAAPVTAVARPSSASAARTSLPPLLAMVPVALILRPDPDIRARSVLDRGEIGYDALILIDVSRQGEAPGTLYVMEADQDDVGGIAEGRDD